MLTKTMRGSTNDVKIDAVRVVMGLVMVGIGAYLFYTERKRTVNRRDWLVVVGALMMAVGLLFGFGLFFGSIILVDDMIDWFK